MQNWYNGEVAVKAQPADDWDGSFDDSLTSVWDERFNKGDEIDAYIIHGSTQEEIVSATSVLENGASSLLTVSAAVIAAICANAF